MKDVNTALQAISTFRGGARLGAWAGEVVWGKLFLHRKGAGSGRCKSPSRSLLLSSDFAPLG
jgi:hypothetical protein